MAFNAQDPDMVAAFAKGDVDFHRFIAAEVNGIPEAAVTDDQRKAAGAGPDVVRLSIGIEDKADIIADLDQALDGLPA